MITSPSPTSIVSLVYLCLIFQVEVLLYSGEVCPINSNDVSLALVDTQSNLPVSLFTLPYTLTVVGVPSVCLAVTVNAMFPPSVP